MGIFKRRLEEPSKRLVENKQKETGGKRSYHPSVMDKEAQRDLSSRRSNLIWSLIGHDAQSAERSKDLTLHAEEGRKNVPRRRRRGGMELLKTEQHLYMKTETDRNIPRLGCSVTDRRNVPGAFTAG